MGLGAESTRRLALSVGGGRTQVRELRLIRRRSRVPWVFLVYHRALTASVLTAKERGNIEGRRLGVVLR